ncbi:hypothetical protein [Nocardioides kribbensis]|uniref:hypothetical protein n=1 Tax=Nocardioides kribbensis TaxID=305517 RepID=UPI001879691C|nr:hypothetical protein [Nocardioides kribbensis]
MSLHNYLRNLPGRCTSCGSHLATQGCTCPGGDWVIFTSALRTVADQTGTIHQSAMRRLIRGRVAPKAIGTFYRRAKAEGLIVDTGEREPSNDVAGRNADKLDRIYRLAVESQVRAA